MWRVVRHWLRSPSTCADDGAQHQVDDGQISGLSTARTMAASPSPLSQGRGGTAARADDAVISTTHRYQTVSVPAERMPRGAACCGAGIKQHTNKPDDMLSATLLAMPGHAPAEARHAAQGTCRPSCVSRCHRCWAATAASSTTRALAVFACAEPGVRCRCRVTSSGASWLLPPLSQLPTRSLGRRGWLRGPERPASSVLVVRRPLGTAKWQAALSAASVWLLSGSACTAGVQLEAARFPYRFRAACNGYHGAIRTTNISLRPAPLAPSALRHSSPACNHRAVAAVALQAAAVLKAEQALGVHAKRSAEQAVSMAGGTLRSELASGRSSQREY